MGEMLLCPAWEEHSVEVVESESEFINIEFCADDEAFEGLPLNICNRWPERAQALIRTLRAEVELADSVTPLAVEALAWECLDLFRSPPPQRRRQLPRGVAAARELLEARFRTPPSLSEIVAEVGGDPSNLSRSFRKWIGCPMGAYVRTRRLSEARLLLKKTHLPIGHIADACGYADQAHMTRAFTQSLGVTPRKFRIDNA
jgi:AraC-like DNA-binding protein